MNRRYPRAQRAGSECSHGMLAPRRQAPTLERPGPEQLELRTAPGSPRPEPEQRAVCDWMIRLGRLLWAAAHRRGPAHRNVPSRRSLRSELRSRAPSDWTEGQRQTALPERCGSWWVARHGCLGARLPMSSWRTMLPALWTEIGQTRREWLLAWLCLAARWAPESLTADQR